MKALELRDQLGARSLVWTERPNPRPGPGEVLVRLSAASLNFRDLQVIDGRRAVRLPLVPLSDGAGTVVEVGAGVSAFVPGDRVMPCFVQGWLAGPQPQGEILPTLGGPLDGVCRELGVWPETGLVRVPDHLTDSEAATLPCAAVSAWNALFEADRVRPGEIVLVQGTGGVSLFALQFARLAGAEVIAVSGSDAKLTRARSLGASAGINYRAVPEWGARAREIAGRGVNHVVEVGGEQSIAQSIAALANGGHLGLVGSVSGGKAAFDLGELSRKSIRISGVRVGPRDSFERMCRAISLHGLRPVIDSEFPAAAFRDALARLRSGAHVGKICLRLADAEEPIEAQH